MGGGGVGQTAGLRPVVVVRLTRFVLLNMPLYSVRCQSDTCVVLRIYYIISSVNDKNNIE